MDDAPKQLLDIGVGADLEFGRPTSAPKRRRVGRSGDGCSGLNWPEHARDNSACVFDDLPNEVLAEIVARLTCADIWVRLRCVSRRLCAVVMDAVERGRLLCLGSTLPTSIDRLIDRAAECGHVACVGRYIVLGQKPLARTFCAAAAGGHIDVLARLADEIKDKDEGVHTWDEATCSAAARNGHIDCLVFARSRGCPWDGWALIAAHDYDQVACADYAHANGCPELSVDSAVSGHPWHGQVARAAHEHLLSGFDWHPIEYADECMSLDYIDCGGLVYAYKHGLASDAVLCRKAAAFGLLAFLEFAKRHGLEWDATACSAAAAVGHLGSLAYLHEAGCPWDSDATFGAASEGHLGCLDYLCSHGCPVDPAAALSAARVNGHDDCYDRVVTFCGLSSGRE
jgi:hypothetical protein